MTKSISILFLMIFMAGVFLGEPPAYGKSLYGEAYSIWDNLHKDKYELDTSANAIVLYEFASYSIGRYAAEKRLLIKRVKKVIKILNKKGVEFGNVEVHSAFSKYHFVNFKEVKGTTYYLEGGEMKSAKIKSKEVKRDILDYNHLVDRFVMPAVQPGAIIEYEYITEEPLTYMLGMWRFQAEIPKLYSEVMITTPDYYEVSGITQTRDTFRKFDDTKVELSDSSAPTSYVTPVTNLYDGQTRCWVRRNVKPYINEPFISNIGDHIEQITLQISRTSIGKSDNPEAHATWAGFNTALAADSFFLAQFDRRHDTIDATEKQIVKDKVDKLDIAKGIFKYLRDSITTTVAFGLYPGGNLDKVIKEKKGSGTDKILLLIYMMRKAGLDCDPVLLSTKGNLKIMEVFPLLDRFNYVICELRCYGFTYYLDVADKYTSFGILPYFCYNGFSWVATAKGHSIDLKPDMLIDKSAIIVKTENPDVNDYTLSVTHYYGNGTAPIKRKEWIRDTASIRKDIVYSMKTMPFEAVLKNFEVVNLYSLDSTLTVKYSFRVPWDTSNHNYFVPTLLNYYKENPFKAAKRLYPVELPSAVDAYYSLILQFPPKYKLEDSLKSVEYRFAEKNSFKYSADYNAGNSTLSLNTRLTLGATFFDASLYEGLKEFFDRIIEKQQTPYLIKKHS